MKNIRVAIHKLNKNGVGEKVGFIVVQELPHVIRFDVNVSGIDKDGEHGFHIHEHGNLMPSIKEDGTIVAGGMAGQHWDPLGSGHHGKPNGNGHLGDLPKLTSKNGSIQQTVFQYRIPNLDSIMGKSLVIHRFGDNYSDNPLPNGGGKSRMLGGIIEPFCRYCVQSNPKKKSKRKKKGTRDSQGRFIPEKYLKGYKGKRRQQRIDEIEQRRDEYNDALDKYGDEDDFPKTVLKKLYRPFKTDKGIKSKKSSYTVEAKNRGFTGSVKNKAEQASEYYGGKVPFDILEQVKDRGYAAWASGGHRPGQSSHSWGIARVNSFLVGGKTFFTADSDLADQLSDKVYNAILDEAVYEK